LTWGTSSAFLDHFGLDDITDLPGLDELKSAGLLRKGQILGALMDSPATNQDDDSDEEGDDLLDDQLMEEAMVEAGLNVNSDEEGADA
jgi:segregation and condensation protein B